MPGLYWFTCFSFDLDRRLIDAGHAEYERARREFVGLLGFILLNYRCPLFFIEKSNCYLLRDIQYLMIKILDEKYVRYVLLNLG